MMPEAAVSAEALAARLEALIAAPLTLEMTAAHARLAARLLAARDLADIVERLVPGNGMGYSNDPFPREEAA
jgi:hypothetical protein